MQTITYLLNHSLSVAPKANVYQDIRQGMRVARSLTVQAKEKKKVYANSIKDPWPKTN